MAQEVISNNKALASGGMVGLSNGIGGISVVLVGIIAEYLGISYAINLLVWIAWPLGLFCLVIKEKQTDVMITS